MMFLSECGGTVSQESNEHGLHGRGSAVAVSCDKHDCGLQTGDARGLWSCETLSPEVLCGRAPEAVPSASV